MKEIIKNLSPTRYQGTFSETRDNLEISGSFDTDGRKHLTALSGSVSKEGVQLCSFTSWDAGDQLRYNFSDVTDLEGLGDTMGAIKSVQESIEAELSAQ